ncbi:hypothetical protein [Gallibacterium sp. AGMB14963]|uniref:hypothetical protein n=1 Tax=Gallibacterium faecale TaxID=3019086 RepID=UPI0022F18913|nr:hypothetical protein [Gallibacterium sp. AGMB14963]MDA3978590.1 hypothetical protein [Gallibacterium sp. AGMB14963]
MAKLPTLSSQFIAVSGGMDLTTPPIVKMASDAIVAMNVQPKWGGGFTRIDGYECLDGKFVPSNMKYCGLSVLETVPDELKGKQFRINDTICYVLDVKEHLFVVAYYDRLSINVNETFFVEGSSFTLLVPPHYLTDDIEQHHKYQAMAIDIGIANVTAPNGDGNLLGVVELDDQVIVFRNTGDTCRVYISDEITGWKEANETYITQLSNITNIDSLLDNATLNVGNEDILCYSCNISPDNLSGFIVVDQYLEANSDIFLNGSRIATVSESHKVTLTKDLCWKFIYHNFYGGVDSNYAYGCNGSEAIEVRRDGIIIPIAIGNLGEPLYISEHKNHLFIGFRGGLLGHSQVGYPTKWSSFLGSEQFWLGSEITALTSLSGGVLLIGCRNKSLGLYGSTLDDWQLKQIASVGISPNTLQSLFIPVAISKNGIIRIDSTEQFGDFLANELDANQKLGNIINLNISYSASFPELNQVRFYSKNNVHICVMFLPDGTTRVTEFSYPQTLNGVWRTPYNCYFAFNDGRLYRNSDKINSFNGYPINWTVRLAYNHCGGPHIIKHWKYAEIQSTSSNYLTFKFQYSLDYNSAKQPNSVITQEQIRGSGGNWNESLWNEFLWSAESYSTPIIPLAGYSKNISFLFSGNSNYSPNFEITGFTLNYIIRRYQRV